MMEILQELTYVNWWAIIAATAATMALGALWYGPLFGKQWMKLEGLTKEDTDNADGSPKVYAQMGVIAFITAIVVAMLVRALEVTAFMDLIILGVLLGVVLRGATHYIHDGFSARKPGVTLIHAGYDAVVVMIVTIVVGVWQ